MTNWPERPNVGREAKSEVHATLELFPRAVLDLGDQYIFAP